MYIHLIIHVHISLGKKKKREKQRKRETHRERESLGYYLSISFWSSENWAAWPTENKSTVHTLLLLKAEWRKWLGPGEYT